MAEIRIRIDDFWTRACVHRAVPRKGGKIFKFSLIGLGETGSGAFVARGRDLFPRCAPDYN